MPLSAASPLVIIPSDHRIVGLHAVHTVQEKYIAAVREAAEALPLLLPSLDPPVPPEVVLARADGVLVTGSPSNVAPARYGGPPPREGVLQDERRDETTLALIRAAVEQGVPLFCICRGFQELNVAFGGTLHQHLQEIEGRADHREKKGASLDVQYGPAHIVSIIPGGQIAEITGAAAIEVNSLHSQGIDRLADGLMPEAVAPDGTIEAVSVKNARAFALGVQWHPEWNFADNPVSRALFRAFGKAVRARQQQKAIP